MHKSLLSSVQGGRTPLQQENVQAIGIYPGNFTELADALLSCGELTSSILRLLAFSQALVWFFCLGLFEDGITGLRHYP